MWGKKRAPGHPWGMPRGLPSVPEWGLSLCSMPSPGPSSTDGAGGKSTSSAGVVSSLPMTSRSHFPKSTAFSLQVAAVAVAVRGRAGRHGGRVGRRNACAGASRLAVEGAADGLDVAAGAVHEALADLPAHLHKPLPLLLARTRMENTDSWAKNPGKGKGEDYRAEPWRRRPGRPDSVRGQGGVELPPLQALPPNAEAVSLPLTGSSPCPGG